MKEVIHFSNVQKSCMQFQKASGNPIEMIVLFLLGFLGNITLYNSSIKRWLELLLIAWIE